MTDPSLVIAGHSHSIALGVPPTRGTREPAVVDLQRAGATVTALIGSSPRDDAYWAALVAESERRRPVIAWDGNQHQAHFLFEQKPPFDFVLSSNPDTPIAREVKLVPESHLRAFFEPNFAPLRDLLGRLPPGTKPILCGTPPPKGGESVVRPLLAQEPIFVRMIEKRGSSVAQIRLTEASIMLKLWALVQDMTAEAARSVGGQFVPVPAAARNKKGFLVERYWSGDVTHANGEFGRLMLDQVIAAASDGSARADGTEAVFGLNTGTSA